MPIQTQNTPPYYRPISTPLNQLYQNKSGVEEFTTAGLHPYATYTIPANSITQSGQGFTITMVVNYVTVVAGARIYVKLNGIAIQDLAMSGTGLNTVIYTILYNTNTTAVTLAEGYVTSLLRQYALATGIDWTINNVLEIGINNIGTDTTQGLASTGKNLFSTI